MKMITVPASHLVTTKAMISQIVICILYHYPPSICDVDARLNAHGTTDTPIQAVPTLRERILTWPITCVQILGHHILASQDLSNIEWHTNPLGRMRLRWHYFFQPLTVDLFG
jgi:hypothetical protein